MKARRPIAKMKKSCGQKIWPKKINFLPSDIKKKKGLPADLDKGKGKKYQRNKLGKRPFAIGIVYPLAFLGIGNFVSLFYQWLQQSP